MLELTERTKADAPTSALLELLAVLGAARQADAPAAVAGANRGGAAKAAESAAEAAAQAENDRAQAAIQDVVEASKQQLLEADRRAAVAPRLGFRAPPEDADAARNDQSAGRPSGDPR